MTEVVVKLWLLQKITRLQSNQAVILHFIFGYWEFCDYLLLILAWMLILYLMTLSVGGVCVCVHLCVRVRGWLGLSSSQVWHYFLIHVFNQEKLDLCCINHQPFLK